MPSYDVRNVRELGQVVKRIREQKGLSTTVVGEELNLDRQYVARLEKGVPNLFTTRVFRILRLLGARVTISWKGPEDLND